MHGRDSPHRRAARSLDKSLAALLLILVASTVAVVVVPDLRHARNVVALDVAINVASTLVGAAVAILAWIRWQVTREPVALYESSAFVALTVVNAVLVGLVVGGREAEFGLSDANPGEAPVYLWILARWTTAALLVVGAARSLGRRPPVMPPLAVAVLPAMLIVIVAWVLFPSEAVLPAIAGIDSFAAGSTQGSISLAAVAIGLLEALTFAAFLFAAVLFRQLYLRDRLISHGFLAFGLVVAAFSQVHFALDPVVTMGTVTSADALRLGFTAVLFMGIQAELDADLRALRRANEELRRLRDVDASNAAMAERTRLAREIHDGLAQDLWYAKLKQGRIAQDPALPEPTRTTAREVATAIDSALAEARQAVMAMRADVAGGSSLVEVLQAYVEDFSDRFGVWSEFHAEAAPAELPARTEAEVLRIVQEALNNVHRHADATIVRVSIQQSNGRLRVAVADNGRGFEPGRVAPDRFGLRGMRERADLVGASLDVLTSPGDGTRIAVDLPLPAARPT